LPVKDLFSEIFYKLAFPQSFPLEKGGRDHSHFVMGTVLDC